MERFEFLDACSQISHIDVEAGLKVSVGSLTNYKKALFVALKSIRGKLPIIFSMVDYKEYDGFITIASTLSRICMNVGAKGVGRMTEELQTAALNGNYSVVADKLPKLGRELEALLTELEEALRVMDHLEKKSFGGLTLESPSEKFLSQNYKAI